MVYHPLRVILCQKHTCRITAVILFNQKLGDYGIHTFPPGIIPKMNILARLELKLAYFNTAVHYFNHYASGTPLESHRYGAKCTNNNRTNFGVEIPHSLVSFHLEKLTCVLLNNDYIRSTISDTFSVFNLKSDQIFLC